MFSMLSLSDSAYLSSDSSIWDMNNVNKFSIPTDRTLTERLPTIARIFIVHIQRLIGSEIASTYLPVWEIKKDTSALYSM